MGPVYVEVLCKTHRDPQRGVDIILQEVTDEMRHTLELPVTVRIWVYLVPVEDQTFCCVVSVFVLFKKLTS